jgi:hypothetical protein
MKRSTSLFTSLVLAAAAVLAGTAVAGWWIPDNPKTTLEPAGETELAVEAGAPLGSRLLTSRPQRTRSMIAVIMCGRVERPRRP